LFLDLFPGFFFGFALPEYLEEFQLVLVQPLILGVPFGLSVPVLYKAGQLFRDARGNIPSMEFPIPGVGYALAIMGKVSIVLTISGLGDLGGGMCEGIQ